MGEMKFSELIEMIPGAFIPEKAGGVSAVVIFQVSGEGGGDWTMRIENGTCRVNEGKADSYDLKLEGNAQDALDVFAGKVDPMRAYMQGKVRLSGNMMLAMRIFGLFQIPKLG